MGENNTPTALKGCGEKCFMQLRDFGLVKQFFTRDATILVANALANSQLDYCNLFFRNLSSIYINYSVFKIVLLELYQTSVDAPV